MNLEIRHLKLVATVAETGSITKAGHKLHLTQSALSHQLRDIEERLGGALFLRLNKRMVLTQAGERLLHSARKVIDELRRAEEEIRQITLSREGVLRISTECYTCYHWLPPMLKAFGEKFPRVEVRIELEATRRPFQALLDGRLDLAVVHTVVRDRRLCYKPLFQDELVVVMRPDHPLACRPYISAQDFADQHLLVYTAPKEELFVFQQVLEPAGVAPGQLSQVQLTEAIIEMVKAGIGITVMARWAVAPQVETGVLRALPLTKKGLYRRWSAAMLRHKAMPPHLREFVELLAASSPPPVRGEERRRPPRSRAGAAPA